MMELKIKDMSYGLLLSHTFPGLLFGLEIVLAFELFTKYSLYNFLFTVEGSVTNVLTGLVAVFVSATIFGFILDGIHHFLFEDLWGQIKKVPKYRDMQVYSTITSIEQMQIYKHFLEEDLWYPYEAYANISLAMFPGLFLMPYWLFCLKVNIWFLIIASIIYVLVFCIMIFEAYSTLDLFDEAENNMLDNFAKQNSASLRTKNNKP